jgi:omega-6 fatty acid desaturase (delta-12 desaturase)
MTLVEYQEASPWLRWGYRLYRSPLLMFLTDMILGFVVLFRLPQTGKTPAAQRGILATNMALVALWGMLSLGLGWSTVLIVQASIFMIGASMGVFLFFVQHMFEGTYWVRDHDWDFRRAAMEGASFFDLPGILHFFTGNIGYHHVHHLNPKVPNYHLRTVHHSHPIFSTAKTLSLKEALSTFQLKLWDEQAGRFCSDYPFYNQLPTSTKGLQK